jgi:hypothetical protein
MPLSFDTTARMLGLDTESRPQGPNTLDDPSADAPVDIDQSLFSKPKGVRVSNQPRTAQEAARSAQMDVRNNVRTLSPEDQDLFDERVVEKGLDPERPRESFLDKTIDLLNAGAYTTTRGLQTLIETGDASTAISAATAEWVAATYPFGQTPADQTRPSWMEFFDEHETFGDGTAGRIANIGFGLAADLASDPLLWGSLLTGPGAIGGIAARVGPKAAKAIKVMEGLSAPAVGASRLLLKGNKTLKFGGIAPNGIREAIAGTAVGETALGRFSGTAGSAADALGKKLDPQFQSRKWHVKDNAIRAREGESTYNVSEVIEGLKDGKRQSKATDRILRDKSREFAQTTIAKLNPMEQSMMMMFYDQGPAALKSNVQAFMRMQGDKFPDASIKHMEEIMPLIKEEYDRLFDLEVAGGLISPNSYREWYNPIQLASDRESQGMWESVSKRLGLLQETTANTRNDAIQSVEYLEGKFTPANYRAHETLGEALLATVPVELMFGKAYNKRSIQSAKALSLRTMLEGFAKNSDYVIPITTENMTKLGKEEISELVRKGYTIWDPARQKDLVHGFGEAALKDVDGHTIYERSQEVVDQTTAYMIPKAYVDDFVKADRGLYDPRSSDHFTRTFDKIYGTWKGYALFSGGYIGRNFATGQYSNFVNWGPKEYATKGMKYSAMDMAVQAGGTENLPRGIRWGVEKFLGGPKNADSVLLKDMNGREWTLAELATHSKSNGLHGSGIFPQDIGQGMQSALLKGDMDEYARIDMMRNSWTPSASKLEADMLAQGFDPDMAQSTARLANIMARNAELSNAYIKDPEEWMDIFRVQKATGPGPSDALRQEATATKIILDERRGPSVLDVSGQSLNMKRIGEFQETRGMTLRELMGNIEVKALGGDAKLIAKRVGEHIERLEKQGMKFNYKISELAEGSKVNLREATTPTIARGTSSGSASMSKGGDEVTVFLNGIESHQYSGLNYSTALHEGIHAATMASIRIGNRKSMAGTPLAKSVKDLYDVSNQITKHFNDRIRSIPKESVDSIDDHLTLFEIKIFKGQTNALSNPDEVLAWALTDRDTQKYLETIKLPNGETAWTQFVEAIRKMIGLDAKDNTALSKVLKIGDELLSPNAAISPKSKASTSVSRLEQTSGKGRGSVKGFISEADQAIGGGPRFSGRNGPASWFIDITKAGDESTIVHEFGHLLRLSGTLDQEQLSKLSKFLGSDARRHHMPKASEEKFAKAFEAFLKEGTIWQTQTAKDGTKKTVAVNKLGGYGVDMETLDVFNTLRESMDSIYKAVPDKELDTILGGADADVFKAAMSKFFTRGDEYDAAVATMKAIGESRSGVKKFPKRAIDFFNRKLGTNGDALSFVRKYAAMSEDNIRGQNFLYQLGEGKLDEVNATRDSFNWHFDYDELTEFERNTMKHFIPFYTWMRKNIPLQMEAMARDPFRYKLAPHHAVNAVEGLTRDWNTDEPDYFTDLNAIRLPMLMGGQPVSFNARLPYVDINEVDPRKWIASANPMIKLPVEMYLNSDSFTGRPIQRFEGEGAQSDMLNSMGVSRMQEHAIKSALPPVSKLLTMGKGISDNPTTGVFNAVSEITPFFGGSKVLPSDLEKNKINRAIGKQQILNAIRRNKRNDSNRSEREGSRTKSTLGL